MSLNKKAYFCPMVMKRFYCLLIVVTNRKVYICLLLLENMIQKRKSFRQMLNKGIVGLAALVMPYVSAFGQTQTEAERALAQFPDTLPGAAKVEKYPVKGAKQVLVHLKNIHDGAYGQGRLPTNHVVYPYMLQGAVLHDSNNLRR